MNTWRSDVEERVVSVAQRWIAKERILSEVGPQKMRGRLRLRQFNLFESWDEYVGCLISSMLETPRS